MSTPTGPRPRSDGSPPVVGQDDRRLDPATRPASDAGPATHESAEPEQPTAQHLRPGQDTPADEAAGPGATGRRLPGTEAANTEGQASAEAEQSLAACVADLQRVQAEFDNYRKRVKRDRQALQEAAVANVLRGLLPVLDAIKQAREQAR